MSKILRHLCKTVALLNRGAIFMLKIIKGGYRYVGISE